jgi:hypothetical protein
LGHTYSDVRTRSQNEDAGFHPQPLEDHQLSEGESGVGKVDENHGESEDLVYYGYGDGEESSAQFASNSAAKKSKKKEDDPIATQQMKEWFKRLETSGNDYEVFPDGRPSGPNPRPGYPIPERLCYIIKGLGAIVPLLTGAPVPESNITGRQFAAWFESGHEWKDIMAIVSDGVSKSVPVASSRSTPEGIFRHRIQSAARRWLLENGHVVDGRRVVTKQYLGRLLQLSNAQLFYGVIGDLVPGQTFMSPPLDHAYGTGPHPNIHYSLPTPKDVPANIRNALRKGNRDLPTFAVFRQRTGL